MALQLLTLAVRCFLNLSSEKIKTLNPEMTRQLVKMIARPLERSELVTIPT